MAGYAPIEIQIEVNTQDVEEGLRRVQGWLHRFFNVSFRDLVDTLLERVQRRTPGRSGLLRMSWVADYEYDNPGGMVSRGTIYSVVSDQRVLHWLEDGVPAASFAGKIRAQSYPWVLSFPLPLSRVVGNIPRPPRFNRWGEVYIIRSTKRRAFVHPGIKPYRMVGQTYDEGLQMLQTFVNRVSRELEKVYGSG